MKAGSSGRRVVSLTVCVLLANFGHLAASDSAAAADLPAAMRPASAHHLAGIAAAPEPIPTCTSSISHCTPPALLNHILLAAPSSNNLYFATADQRASLSVLEDEAVDNVLADHGLPDGDAAAVMSWARADALAELWGLIVEAIRTDAGQRSPE